jgi:catechol 2,3-dioxygenase-like lactoylglutathione lyase family enzyme
MTGHIGLVSIVVRDYDEAIDFYTRVLGFELVEDTVLSPVKRWVVVRPSGSGGRGCDLLLAKAAGSVQESRIGNQTGGRVFLFLYTDDIRRDHESLLRQGVDIVRPPSKEEYGTVLVFSDLYGNLWDLIEKA